MAQHHDDKPNDMPKPRPWRSEESIRARREASRQYKLDHPDKNREWKRKHYHRNAEQVRYYAVQKKYGLNREQYDQMYLDQNGCCAICGVDFSELTRRPAVDHDHKTGRVRALLCNSCNVRVGFFENSHAWRDRVEAYLAEFGRK